jgi:hypothetical protein
MVPEEHEFATRAQPPVHLADPGAAIKGRIAEGFPPALGRALVKCRQRKLNHIGGSVEPDLRRLCPVPAPWPLRDWTIVGLALRGFVAFEPLLPAHPASHRAASRPPTTSPTPMGRNLAPTDPDDVSDTPSEWIDRQLQAPGQKGLPWLVRGVGSANRCPHRATATPGPSARRTVERQRRPRSPTALPCAESLRRQLICDARRKHHCQPDHPVPGNVCGDHHRDGSLTSAVESHGEGPGQPGPRVRQGWVPHVVGYRDLLD